MQAANCYYMAHKLKMVFMVSKDPKTKQEEGVSQRPKAVQKASNTYYLILSRNTLPSWSKWFRAPGYCCGRTTDHSGPYRKKAGSGGWWRPTTVVTPTARASVTRHLSNRWFSVPSEEKMLSADNIQVSAPSGAPHQLPHRVACSQ